MCISLILLYYALILCIAAASATKEHNTDPSTTIFILFSYEKTSIFPYIFLSFISSLNSEISKKVISIETVLLPFHFSGGLSG